MKINVKKIIEGKLTYPSWTTGSQHVIKCDYLNNKEVLVHYNTKGPIVRKISRKFPKFIDADHIFIWVLGFLKGEGSNSKGKSNYRRFTITNKNPEFIILTLKVLYEKGLLYNDLPDKTCHIIHSQDKLKAMNYWQNKLGLDKSKFSYIDDNNKTSLYGVCHVYLSDVLLRRVVDEINEFILAL